MITENMQKGIKTESVGLKLKLTSENCFSILLGLIWTNTTLVNYIRYILIQIPYISNIRIFIEYFVLLMFVILSLPYMSRHISPKLILGYLAIVVVCVLNILIYPQNQVALGEVLPTFLLKVLPLVFVGVSVDLKKHNELLYRLSVISVVCILIREALNPTNIIAGDMHSSYILLPHICMVIITTFSRNTVWNVLLSLFGGFLVVAYGSRGPVVCMLTLILMYCFFYKKLFKSIRNFVTMTVAVILIRALYDEILQLINSLVQQVGMSTRILDKIFLGELFESAGRSRIQEQLLYAASQNWFGYGIAADRTITGYYTHNLLIELWVSYGFFMGSFLLAIPVFYLVKLLIRKRKNPVPEDGVILVLVASSFVRLFMSGSYLAEPLLFLLIGIVMTEYRKLKLKETKK